MNFNEIIKNDSYEQLHELIDSHVHFLHELNVEFLKGRQSIEFQKKKTTSTKRNLSAFELMEKPRK